MSLSILIEIHICIYYCEGETINHLNLNLYLPKCCFSDYRYEIFNTTSVNTQEFKVVHFSKAFQFVPTGRCRYVTSYEPSHEQTNNLGFVAGPTQTKLNSHRK